jgi:hypothetical protein
VGRERLTYEAARTGSTPTESVAENGDERTWGVSVADERAKEHPPGLRDDHEDGGPTIQLPAAEAAAPLICLQASIAANERAQLSTAFTVPRASFGGLETSGATLPIHKRLLDPFGMVHVVALFD